MNQTAVNIENVSIQVGETVILQDVNAHIPVGSSTAIVGPNGAGKTSLTLAILGQMSYKGKITFPGCKNPRKPRFGFVPQKLQFDRDMPITVQDYLLAGLQRFPLFFGTSAVCVKKIKSVLEELECEKLLNRVFGALSGGEIQRILLAQALLTEPEIMVLDEPTAGVDFKGGQICCELLRKIREDRGFTQIMVSHDLATVAAHASHVICLKGSVIAEGAPKKVLTHKVLTRTFGLHLGIPDLHDLPEDAANCPDNCPYHSHGTDKNESTHCCHGGHHHHHHHTRAEGDGK